MPVESIDDITRRLCLLYPWSRECQGVAPIEPSPGESAGIWTGPGGLEYVTSSKNIPTGSKCEAVQLVPLDAIGKRFSSPATLGGKEVQSSNNIEYSFPRGAGVVSRSCTADPSFLSIFPHSNSSHRRIIINNFLYHNCFALNTT